MTPTLQKAGTEDMDFYEDTLKALNTYKKSKRPALEKIACLEQAIPIVDAAISEYQEEIS